MNTIDRDSQSIIYEFNPSSTPINERVRLARRIFNQTVSLETATTSLIALDNIDINKLIELFPDFNLGYFSDQQLIDYFYKLKNTKLYRINDEWDFMTKQELLRLLDIELDLENTGIEIYRVSLENQYIFLSVKEYFNKLDNDGLSNIILNNKDMSDVYDSIY